jgi:hypothetical protein
VHACARFRLSTARSLWLRHDLFTSAAGGSHVALQGKLRFQVGLKLVCTQRRTLSTSPHLCAVVTGCTVLVHALAFC